MKVNSTKEVVNCRLSPKRKFHIFIFEKGEALKIFNKFKNTQIHFFVSAKFSPLISLFQCCKEGAHFVKSES